jgi:hypothetical protein
MIDVISHRLTRRPTFVHRFAIAHSIEENLRAMLSPRRGTQQAANARDDAVDGTGDEATSTEDPPQATSDAALDDDDAEADPQSTINNGKFFSSRLLVRDLKALFVDVGGYTMEEIEDSDIVLS